MSPKPPHSVRNRVGDAPGAFRDHLIATTDALLADRPALSLTTREIARAAGVSDGVLYNHFADKNDLLIAALLRRYERLQEGFVAAIPLAGTGALPDNLAAIGNATLGLIDDALPMIAGLLAAPALLHELIAKLYDMAVAMPLGPLLLSRYIAAEQDLGRIASDVDPSAVANTLFGTAFAMAIGGLAVGGARSDSSLRAMVNTLLRGLEPRG